MSSGYRWGNAALPKIYIDLARLSTIFKGTKKVLVCRIWHRMAGKTTSELYSSRGNVKRLDPKRPQQLPVKSMLHVSLAIPFQSISYLHSVFLQIPK